MESFNNIFAISCSFSFCVIAIFCFVMIVFLDIYSHICIEIIDDNINISFQVEKNMSILGVVSGDGNGKIEGYTFDGDSGIVEGDVLITTGIGMYPEGIEIGNVTAVDYNSDTQAMSLP